MSQFGSLRSSLIAGLALTLPGLLSASALGTMAIEGIGPVRISVSTIDFSSLGGGADNVVVSGAWEGFAAVPIHSFGTIADMTSPPATAGPPLAVPIYPFLIVGHPDAMLAFSLEQIALGVGVPCTVPPGDGESCSPTELVPDTMLLLTQGTNAVFLEFEVKGTVFDLSDSSSATYYARFMGKATSDGAGTIPEVMFALGPDGPGFVDFSWTAEFTSTGIFPSTEVPEAATLALMGGGLALLAGSGRRRRACRATR